MITVTEDRGFNDRADGFIASHPSMDAPVIDMPNLSSLLSGFDHQPAPVRPGSFIENAIADSQAYGQRFAAQLEQTRMDAANYWGAPAQAQPAISQPAMRIDPFAAAPVAKAPDMVSGLDRLGGLADGLANSLTGSQPQAPAMPEVGVEMASLSRSFGTLAPSQPEQGLTAFERRYQQPGTPRKGNDYA